MENEHFFVSEQDSSPIYRVSSETVVLGKGAGQSIDRVGNKQDEKMGNIFGKMGDTGTLIQGNKSAGHCFEVIDLIPMNFFKYVVIMKLKMCTAGKKFSTILW